MPKYSIITPVYNVENYLTQFLNCILNQSYKDFELILIDDGSTDKSGAYCDNIASSYNRIKVIHKKNGGVSSARNRGLDDAQGDWILFYDPDDIIPNNALETIDRTLKKHPEIEVLLYNYTIVYQNKKRERGHHQIPTNKPLHKEEIQHYILGSTLLKNNVLRSPWTKVYKRSVLNATGIRFSNRTFAEDYLFNLMLFPHINNAIAIEDSLYDYYIHPGTAIGRYHKGILNIWLEDTLSELSIYERHKVWVDKSTFDSYVKRSFSSLCYAMLSVYQNEYNSEPIFSNFLKDRRLQKIILTLSSYSVKKSQTHLFQAIQTGNITLLHKELWKLQLKIKLINHMSRIKHLTTSWLSKNEY